MSKKEGRRNGKMEEKLIEIFKSDKLQKLTFFILCSICTDISKTKDNLISLSKVIDTIQTEFKLSKKNAITEIKKLEYENFIEIIKSNRNEKGQFISPYIKLQIDVPHNNTTCVKKDKSENEIPTINQIQLYISNNQFNVDANEFYNYYNNNNWKTMKGNSIIQNWKNKVKEWNRNTNNITNTNNKNVNFNDFPNKKNDQILDELELLFLRDINKS